MIVAPTTIDALTAAGRVAELAAMASAAPLGSWAKSLVIDSARCVCSRASPRGSVLPSRVCVSRPAVSSAPSASAESEAIASASTATIQAMIIAHFSARASSRSCRFHMGDVVRLPSSGCS